MDKHAGLPFVYVLFGHHTGGWIERRWLISETPEKVIVSHPCMPAGQTFDRGVVAHDWEDAQAMYWELIRKHRGQLWKELIATDKKLKARKPPRFLKREK